VLPPDVSPRVLRFHARCPFGQEAHPCVLALYRDLVTDEPRAIMRTALTPDAQKIDRKALGPVGGAAIKLSADEERGSRTGPSDFAQARRSPPRMRRRSRS
jgi:hypothetical protein